jgi:hypothetical protein
MVFADSLKVLGRKGDPLGHLFITWGSLEDVSDRNFSSTLLLAGFVKVRGRRRGRYRTDDTPEAGHHRGISRLMRIRLTRPTRGAA